MIRLSGFAAELTEAESVAVTFTVPLNTAVGVPVIWLLLTLNPAGSPEAVKVYGPLPPVAAKAAV